jgi:PilZ domain
VLLFKRLFNFEKAKVVPSEQRLNQRYTPGAAFPLQAALILAGHDWPAKVLNISGNGVGLLVDRAAAPVEGQSARLRLLLDRHRLELDVRIAHLKPAEKGLYCGLGLKFDDFNVQKAYLQFLLPITIGQSLVPVPGERVIQNEPQFIKQVYRGDEGSVLTVWLESTAGTPLHSFEFQMQDYFCKAKMRTGALEAYQLEATESHTAKLTHPVFDTTGGLHDEIRQLFRWIVPNLSKTIPDDVRAVLLGFAA